jgi:ubiquinone/menaquinone biosynthesis C-methylase UbiE
MWQSDLPGGDLTALIATGVVPPGALLDLGCGAGVRVLYLAQAGFHSAGIDLAPSALRIARSLARANNLAVELSCATVLALPYVDASFSLLTDRGCLHHVPEEDHETYAREAARVLKPGGYFLLTGARESEGHFVPLDPDRLRRLFNPYFSVGPIQPYTERANVGSLDMWLAVMKRQPQRP